MILIFNNNSKTLLLFIYLCLGFCFSAKGATTPSTKDNILNIDVVSFKQEHFSKRSQYFIEIMKLALDKSGQEYNINSITLAPHTEKRSVAFIKSKTYSIHWLNTRHSYEEELLPIRIPLFKGLIGLRLLLIREADKNKFSRINTLNELRQLVTLQGDDWKDTTILRKNGFSLKTSTTFENLFRMLAHKRGDLFPRGIAEIQEELDTFPNLNLAVNENIALYYPAAYYFFVSKDNIQLKNIVEKGLNAAIADGSFDEIFMKYFGNVIQQANLKNRTVFHLENPSMPDETPLNRKELWISINDFQKK